MHKTLTTKLGLLAATLLAGLLLLALPQTAKAHDVLVDSEPQIGTTVETTPSDVRLQFSGQPLSGQGLANLIRVTDAQGNQWQDGEVTVSGFDLAVGLCPNMPQGEYRVTYRVIYSDGHTGEEGFSFTNADPNAPEDGDPENCGEVATPETTPTSAATDDASQDAQDTSDADEPTTSDNSSASIPGWVWIAGGVGVVIVAGIIFLLLRGKPASDDDPSDRG